MVFALQTCEVRKPFSGFEVLHGVDLAAVGGSVLALLGENGAGKSTLVKILSGDYKPDSGEIDIDGEVRHELDPISARQLGIRMIFQEIVDAPTLTVAENIALGHLPARMGVVEWATVRRTAEQVLSELDVSLDPGAIVGELRVGERQIIEIARELTGDARCLILDEPTATLSSQEVERLFGFIRRLRDRWVAIIYITHRLDEVPAIADRVQVLRDGHVVIRGEVANLHRKELVQAMVGRAVGEVKRPDSTPRIEAERPVIRLQAAASGHDFAGIALEAYPGEVVALYGKIGSGSAAVAEALFGMRSLTAGTLELKGEPKTFGHPVEAIDAGIGLMPADRQREAAFMVRSVAENLVAPSWPRIAKLGVFVSAGIESTIYGRWHDALGVRSRNDPDQLLATLSGGNQQKVLLGRWLERNSKILVLIEPTRGVDVGARQEIYKLLRSLAADGVAIVVSSSDYEEVVQIADRALVMARGAIVAHLHGDDITTERLIAEGH
ncbi:MAG: sugar ABC transporter ATP-binding protein [Chloroflexota bacterium]